LPNDLAKSTATMIPMTILNKRTSYQPDRPTILSKMYVL
jgi:hypothetical protein